MSEAINKENCNQTTLIDTDGSILIPWIGIFIFFRVLNAVMEEIGLAD